MFSSPVSRATYDWPVDEGGRDPEIVAALNEIVTVEPRWGFWKCFDRLRQLGKPWNHKRVHRVYCQMRLNQKRRLKRRLPKRERQSLVVTPVVNAVWALDFMFDSLYDGRPVRILTCSMRRTAAPWGSILQSVFPLRASCVSSSN